jgi:drug/metabolite transporter (DMT)-like permease
MKISLNEALVIAIAGQVFYHITQKMVAPDAHPVLSLIMFYLVAALLCLPLFYLFPLEQPMSAALSNLNWAVLGVAGAIVLIEMGFLLLYRVGGELSTSSVVSSAVTAVVMLLVGTLFMKEEVSMPKVAGVGLCLAGMVLISWKVK